MASRFKRTSVRKRHAAAKALASGKYRQRVVPNKKRATQGKLARLSHWIPPSQEAGR